MKNVCEHCMRKRKQRYGKETPQNKHHFFTVMLEDFLNHLKIPRKFTDNFGGKLSKTVTLRGPTGETWITKLVKTAENRFILDNGWRVFAMDNNIHVGDFLVFGYLKDSTFQVMIFEPSGCEAERSDHVESSMHESDSSETCKEESQDEDSYDLFFPSPKPNSDIPGTSAASGIRQKNGLKRDRLYPMWYISKRRAVTAQEKRRAERQANLYSSDLPKSCMIKMKPSHVYRRFSLTVPRKFAETYLPLTSQVIQLMVPSEGPQTWEVQFNSRLQQYTLTKGWADFAFDNNLEEDDICILEFAKKGSNGRKTLLNVYIFRVLKDVFPLKMIKP